MEADFNPSLMLRSLEADRTFELEDRIAFMGQWVTELTDDELVLTQNRVQEDRAFKNRAHDVLVAERMRREAPNQVGYYIE